MRWPGSMRAMRRDGRRGLRAPCSPTPPQGPRDGIRPGLQGHSHRRCQGHDPTELKDGRGPDTGGIPGGHRGALPPRPQAVHGTTQTHGLEQHLRPHAHHKGSGPRAPGAPVTPARRARDRGDTEGLGLARDRHSLRGHTSQPPAQARARRHHRSPVRGRHRHRDHHGRGQAHQPP